MKRLSEPKPPQCKRKLSFEELFARRYQMSVGLARFALRWHFRMHQDRRKATLSKYIVRYWKGRRKLVESSKTELGTENPWVYLTERQKEVACLRLQGYQNAAVAKMLKIETATVRTHLRAICRITGTGRVKEGLATLRPYSLN